MASKKAEARKHYEAGEKALKVSLFKWSADVDIAADAFEKAALNFKIAKDYKNAMDAYQRAAKCHADPKCSSTPFHAGKALEAAAACARNLGDAKRSIALIKDAAKQYRLTGKNLSACTVLEKAAQQCDASGDHAEATELYTEIVDLFEEEDKQRQAKRPIERAIASAVKARNFKVAASLLDRQSSLLQGIASQAFVFQSALSHVVVCLAAGDFTGADTAFNDSCARFPGYGSSEEGQLAAQLLEAYENGEEEQLAVIGSKQIFTFLIPEVTSLARSLRIQSTAPVRRAQPTAEDSTRAALLGSSTSKESKAQEAASTSAVTPDTAAAPPPYSEDDPNVTRAREALQQAKMEAEGAPSKTEQKDETEQQADAATDENDSGDGDGDGDGDGESKSVGDVQEDVGEEEQEEEEDDDDDIL